MQADQNFEKTTTQEEADAKTKELGVRIFSTPELEQRAKDAKERRVDGFKVLLNELSNAPELAMLDTMTQEEMAKVYAPAINALFTFAEEAGLSLNDIKAIKKNLIQVGMLLESHENTVDRFMEKLTFNLTRENSFTEVPIRTVQDLIQATKTQ